MPGSDRPSRQSSGGGACGASGGGRGGVEGLPAARLPSQVQTRGGARLEGRGQPCPAGPDGPPRGSERWDQSPAVSLALPAAPRDPLTRPEGHPCGRSSWQVWRARPDVLAGRCPEQVVWTAAEWAEDRGVWPQ